MKRWKALALTGVGLVGIAALISSSAVLAAPRDNNVTLVWWNNANQGAGKALWAQVAKEFEASHPGVKIQDVPLQNEQFTTKIPLALQSNDPPDVFQNWGGGGLVDQVKAGKVADVTKYVSSWIKNIGGSAAGWQVGGQAVRDPVQPGRRRVLVRQGSLREGRDHVTAEDVARSSPPTSQKLKTAGITPIAIGSKDRWPDAFYWDYFATKLCSKATMQLSAVTYNFKDPCWVKAGQLHAAADRHDSRSRTDSSPRPLSRARRARPGCVGNGKAAMELQGHWNPGVMQPLTPGQHDPELPRVVPVPERARQQGHSRLAARRRGRLRLLVEGSRAGVRAVPRATSTARASRGASAARTSACPCSRAPRAR